MSVRPQHEIVAEIFMEVGQAFTRLGELDLLINNTDPEQRVTVTEEDIVALRLAIVKFGSEIDKICQRIKDRTLAQIRNSMKRHAYEEAGLPLRKQQVIQAPKSASALQQIKMRPANSVMSQSTGKSAEMTLAMLNAPDEGDDKL